MPSLFFRVKNTPFYGIKLKLLGGITMFWIGLIVGIVLALAGFVIAYFALLKYFGLSVEESAMVTGMMFDASTNRESALVLVRDDKVEDAVVFEVK